MRAHSSDLTTRLEHDRLSIEGKSIAGNETYFRIREIGIALDIGRCPDFLVPVSHVFVTHAHLDHSLGIPYYWAQRKLQKLDSGRIYVPAETVEDYRNLISVYERLQNTTYQSDIAGMRAGDEAQVGRGLFVRAHEASHSIPARAWEVLERRGRLRVKFRQLPPEEIRRRRLAGEDLIEDREISRVFYTGDTDRRILERGGALFESKILMIECSFTAEGDESRAAEYAHIHLEDLLEFSGDFQNEIVFLTHFSLRDRPDEIVDRIRRRFPSHLRERVRLAFPEPWDRP
jgi:ribonuclease Z